MLKYSDFYEVQPRKDSKFQMFQDGLRYEILRDVTPLHLERFVELVERCREVESIDSLNNNSMEEPIWPVGFQRGGPMRNVVKGSHKKKEDLTFN